jgi:mRNA interferase RelE/StbE
VKYTIVLAKEAEGDLEFLYKTDKKLFGRIVAKIEALSESPREGKALVGNHKGEFSLRVSKYRIVYELDTAMHIVFILTVRHRSHVY